MSFYKIGYRLAYAGGLSTRRRSPAPASRSFSTSSCTISATRLRKAWKSVARLGATFLTVHAYPQTMQAAVEARGGALRILGVTVLTSYDDNDLNEAGYETSVKALVARRAEQARALGIDGLVCSPEEAANVRAIAGGRHGAGDARHPPRRRRGRRPEAHHDAGGGDRGRAPTISWSAGRSSPRPIRAPRRRRSLPRSRSKRARRHEHAEGLLDRARRCAQ